jgi:hypothetical protein
MFCLSPVDVPMCKVQAKFIACFKLDTKWVHIVPMTRCFFQTRAQKIHIITKEVIGLLVENIMVAQVLKKIRQIIIGFDNLTNDDGHGKDDNDILTIASLVSDNRDAGKGGGGGSCDCCCRLPQALAMEPLPPPPPAMGPRMSTTYPALLPPSPPNALAKSIAQFSCMLLPSKTDVPKSTLQANSAASRPAAQIAGPTAPWPSSALLWPTAFAEVINPMAGVCRQCQYPGKPVQAGGVVSQPCPCPPGASRGSLQWCRYCHCRLWWVGRTMPTPRAPTAPLPHRCTLSAGCRKPARCWTGPSQPFARVAKTAKVMVVMMVVTVVAVAES